MRLITWNINSVRLRLPLLAQLVAEQAPDVVCLQETKVADANFPLNAIRDLGFAHIAINGQKGYHGVAILSRMPLKDEAREVYGGKADHARHLAVTLPGGLRLHNFYVPAGGDEPDPETNDKFAHKLAFLQDMAKEFASPGRPKHEVLVGDLNVAPLEHDVWSHKQLLDVVSHTPIEVEHLAAVIKARPFVDVARAFTPEPEKLYTWWSYRAPDWAKADKGRRLDHVWVSKDLHKKVKGYDILRQVRGWTQPSDHAPMVVDFAL